MKKTGIVVASPAKKIRLRDISPDDTGEVKDKIEARERLPKLHERLAELQAALYAENKRSLLIVFQAMDTGGKDGALRSLLTGVDPAGLQVTSFKAPTSTELEHDFLWRIHAATPAKGIIGVWNRSHYEDVLIVRVHDLVKKDIWRARYEHINNFEKMLAGSGVTILKFFFHISKDEQKERLQARLDDPKKNWKFNAGDLKERKLWNDYQKAYEDAINECSTQVAPWRIVPANHKWARDVAVSEEVVKTLEAMNPQYPKADFDPKSIVIE